MPNKATNNDYYFYLLVAIRHSWEEIDRKIIHLNRAIALEPELHPAYETRAEVHYRKQDWQACLADCETALRYGSVDYALYHRRGMCLFHFQDYDAAKDSFLRSIRLHPRFSEAYYGMGLVCEVLHQYTDAISWYGKALDIEPQFKGAYSSRARLHFLTGNLEAALADYEAALEIDPLYLAAREGKILVRRYIG